MGNNKELSQKKKTEEVFENAFLLFKKHLLGLFKELLKLEPEDIDPQALTVNMLEPLCNKIRDYYKPHVEAFHESEEFKNSYGKKREEYKKNANVPDPKSIVLVLRDKNKLAGSTVPEKLAIAYCLIVQSSFYDSSWLIDTFRQDFTDQTLFKSLLENENKTTFLAYFINTKSRVVYAIINIDEEEKISTIDDQTGLADKADRSIPESEENRPRVRDAELKYYSAEFQDRKLNVEGSVIDTGLNLYFDLDYVTGRDYIKSLFTFYKGGKETDEFRYLIGTYSTSTRKGASVCGSVVLERHYTAASALKTMKDPANRSLKYIQNFLYKKRTENDLITVGNLKGFPKYDNVNLLFRNYAGVYEVKYLGMPRKKIYQSFGIITDCGDIILKFPGTNPLTGKFSLIENGSILLAQIAHDASEDYYKLSVVLKGNKTLTKDKYLEGVYSGIGLFSNAPTAGRIILKFKEKYEGVKSFRTLEELHPDSYDLDSEDENAIKNNSYLREFFLGKNDDYIESQATLEEFGISAEKLSRFDYLEKRIADLEARLDNQKPV